MIVWWSRGNDGCAGGLPRTTGYPLGVARTDRGQSLRISRSIAPLILAATLATGLVACAAPATTDKPSSSSKPGTESSAAPSSAPVAAGDYKNADWAKPVTNPGDLLGTVSGTNFQVDIYQVATVKATKTGNFANPDTNKPIIEVGADVVYVNFVATNTSSADIPLSYSLVDISGRYADWRYLQGMDGITDSSLNAQLKVNDSGIAVGAPDSPFIWKPGTSFSYGTNFLHEANGPITFKASLVPALPNGDLDHDNKQEVSVDLVIK